MKAVSAVIVFAIAILGIAIYRLHTKEEVAVSPPPAVKPDVPPIKPPDVKPRPIVIDPPPTNDPPPVVEPVVEPEPWRPIIQQSIIIKR